MAYRALVGEEERRRRRRREANDSEEELLRETFFRNLLNFRLNCFPLSEFQ